MATQRTLAVLQALLADNSSGAISAADMRDLVATLQNGMGEVSITAPADTVVADMVTWLPVAGAWALSPDPMNWDHPSLGRLRYLGPAPRAVHVACSVEADLVTGVNQTIKLCVAKNGVNIVPSITKQFLAGAAQPQSTALHAFTTVVVNDYLDIRILNTTSLDDLRVDFANLFAMDMAI